MISNRIADMTENISAQTLADWALRIATGLFLAAGTWILNGFSEDMVRVQQTSTHNATEIKALKANSYTVRDAMQSREAVQLQLSDIREALTAMERRLPTRTEFEAMNTLVRDLREDLREDRARNGRPGP